MDAVLNIDTTSPVMVTGATGYLAGWIVKDLLEAGVTVHAAVRDPANSAKLRYLDDVAVSATGRIEYFESDLLVPGSYAEAMAGCRIVFHTASPYTSNFKDAQADLINPALLGTRNVLEDANATGSVHRVVLTSSCTAMYTDTADCADAPGGILTEDVWNETASPSYQPYQYSKTVAERAAWQIANGQSRWKLVVINPCFVLGPAIGGQPSSESFNLMRKAGSGEFRTGAPRFGMGVVDVREVAKAHIAAAYLPNAEGRYITCGHASDLLALLQLLQDRFGADYPLPRRSIPKWLTWLIAPRLGLSRKTVARSVDVPWRADNSKSIRDLGMTYRSLRETMEDMFQQMIDSGSFKP